MVLYENDHWQKDLKANNFNNYSDLNLYIYLSVDMIMSRQVFLPVGIKVFPIESELSI